MNKSLHLPPPLIPIQTSDLTLSQVGGKALNLARLTTAGFPVPAGFFIPTCCYRDFVHRNGLEAVIEQALESPYLSSPEALDQASKGIRRAFSAGSTPREMADAIRRGWHWLGKTPVAVRSSATAEDLPEASFAGQQDTFLNVTGEDDLLEAVVDCWSSLWTGRAISYRNRNGVSHHDAALCVVVQRMIPAAVSGVMFTANPLTGRCTEIVIEATFGLGEALVSGQVSPDRYLVSVERHVESEFNQGKEIKIDPELTVENKTLGNKDKIIQAVDGGGIDFQEAQASSLQALPDEAILRLSRLGIAIDDLFGHPQDIEWAWTQGHTNEGETGQEDCIYILQSRPVTSLYPLPKGLPAQPLRVFFSFGAVQGILDPITPLGQDAIRLIFAGGASLFGFDVDQNTQGVLKIAGERLWGNLTPLLQHPIGVKIVPRVLPGVEPGSVAAIHQIMKEPSLQAGKGRLRFDTFRRIFRFVFKMLKKTLPWAHNPEHASIIIRENIEAEIDILRRKALRQTEKGATLENGIALFREIFKAFPFAVPEIASGLLAGMFPLLILNKLARQATGTEDLDLEITRGLPNNVTTEMDLALWEAAQQIRKQEETWNHFRDHSSQDLANQYLQNKLPEPAQSVLASFLGRYGMRGIGEIDIGRPRWQENPTHVMSMIQNYLRIDDPEMAPNVVFERSQKAAQAALEKLATAVRDSFAGTFKERLVRGSARRVRALTGLRESPKFFIIRLMGIIRQELLEIGSDLVNQGSLDKPDDLFYLYLDELETFAGGGSLDVKSLIEERRLNYSREMKRGQVPRLLLSDGRAFYEGMMSEMMSEMMPEMMPAAEEYQDLVGSPVSPGVVEGPVRVVTDPLNSDLAPGEILVCQATDPAWTPLFLSASGLVMEVGGLMTHGSVVAREYGIPAVVGVHQATTRLKTGDTIRLDGSSGRITLLK